MSDLGYTFAHNVGRLALHEELQRTHPEIEWDSAYVENVFFQHNSTQVLYDFAEQCDMVFSCSDATMTTENLWAVSKLYPEVIFVVGSGSRHSQHEPVGWVPIGQKVPRNVKFYDLFTHPTWYRAGAIAAAQSSTNKIAFITAWSEEPTCAQAVTSWKLGAQLIKPDIELHVVSLDAWYDPPAELAAAALLYEHIGCDVLAHYTDGTQTNSYCSEHGPGCHR